MEVSLEEFEEWKVHPVTMEVFSILRSIRDDNDEFMTSGGTVDLESIEATAMKTARTQGLIEGLDAFLNMDHEEAVDD